MRQMADLATRHRLPTVHASRLFAESGGLLAYGPNLSALGYRAATYVDKILLAPGLSHREPSASNRAKIHSTAPAGLTGSSAWVTVG
jgi:ABC-type uncharacterized transport system substrate-binding protein